MVITYHRRLKKSVRSYDLKGPVERSREVLLIDKRKTLLANDLKMPLVSNVPLIEEKFSPRHFKRRLISRPLVLVTTFQVVLLRLDA